MQLNFLERSAKKAPKSSHLSLDSFKFSSIIIRQCWWKNQVKIFISQQTFVLIKTSWRRRLSSSSEDIFKTLGQDKYICLSHRSSKDVLIKINVLVLQKRFQDTSRLLAKTSLIRLENIFKTFCQDISKTSSRRFEDVAVNCFCKTCSTGLKIDLWLLAKGLKYWFYSCSQSIN